MGADALPADVDDGAGGGEEGAPTLLRRARKKVYYCTGILNAPLTFTVSPLKALRLPLAKTALTVTEMLVAESDFAGGNFVSCARPAETSGVEHRALPRAGTVAAVSNARLECLARLHVEKLDLQSELSACLRLGRAVAEIDIEILAIVIEGGLRGH